MAGPHFVPVTARRGLALSIYTILAMSDVCLYVQNGRGTNFLSIGLIWRFSGLLEAGLIFDIHSVLEEMVENEIIDLILLNIEASRRSGFDSHSEESNI